jgi:uncharacterized protein (TIGR03083 family)
MSEGSKDSRDDNVAGMDLAVDVVAGRSACSESVGAFGRAVDAFSEYELLGASRCVGWTRLDVVVHVLAGWQEMLGGMVSIVDAELTVDAASYWSAFAAAFGSEDPVTSLMSQRRRTGLYARPASAVEHLADVGAALVRGIAGLPEAHFLWQGQVFTAGDYLAVWAVENVVHHLDLLSDEPAPPDALSLARATIEALLGETLPSSCTDADATLIGSGRSAVPAELESIAARLPVLG